MTSSQSDLTTRLQRRLETERQQIEETTWGVTLREIEGERFAGLLPKEVRMRAGTGQLEFVPFDAVNQEPVRLKMGRPIAAPDPPERMIEVASG